MGSEYDTGHGLPSEFPSDTSYALLYVVGGGLTLLVLALIAAAILGYLNGYRSRRTTNYDNWPREIAKFIRRKSAEVIRGKDSEKDAPVAFFGSWGGARKTAEPERRNVRDIDYAQAQQLPGYVRGLIGSNLTLAKEISGQLKGLTEALEGYKEIKDPAQVSGAPGGMTGAVINIAINQNGQPVAGEPVQAVAGPYTPAFGTASAQVQPPLVIDRDANIWLAYNKFRDDWNIPDVMAGHLKAAQVTLCERPPEPPKPV